MTLKTKPLAARERNKTRNLIVERLKAQGFAHVKLCRPRGKKFMMFLWDDSMNGIHETLTTTATRIRNYTLDKWMDEGLYFCKLVTAGRYQAPSQVQQPRGTP